jgi:hypothetical protein
MDAKLKRQGELLMRSRSVTWPPHSPRLIPQGQTAQHRFILAYLNISPCIPIGVFQCQILKQRLCNSPLSQTPTKETRVFLETSPIRLISTYFNWPNLFQRYTEFGVRVLKPFTEPPSSAQTLGSCVRISLCPRVLILYCLLLI